MTQSLLQIGIICLAYIVGGSLFKIRRKTSWVLLFCISASIQAIAFLVFTNIYSENPWILKSGLTVSSSFVLFHLFKSRITRWTALASVYALVSLHMLGLLQPAFQFLNQLSIKVGSHSLSLFAILKALLVSGGFIWIAHALSKRVENKLKNHPHLQPSLQILLAKCLKIFLVALAGYLGLSVLGLDLSMFTLFAGAIGVGIAFGLQNILSNFFCGFILLFDRSIKPGDVISINDGKIYGVVNKLHARFVSIRTREGKEHLIPNQEIISNKLENWSYSDTHIRLEIPFKVAYSSDLSLVRDILVDIALNTNRVLSKPRPVVRFRSLTDNAVELLLRYWISDPEKGMSEVQSDIIFSAWKAFRSQGIEIPYPPREFHASSKSQLLNDFLASDLDTQNSPRPE